MGFIDQLILAVYIVKKIIFENTIYEALGFIPERPEQFKNVKGVEGSFTDIPNDIGKLSGFIRNVIL